MLPASVRKLFSRVTSEKISQGHSLPPSLLRVLENGKAVRLTDHNILILASRLSRREGRLGGSPGYRPCVLTDRMPCLRESGVTGRCANLVIDDEFY